MRIGVLPLESRNLFTNEKAIAAPTTLAGTIAEGLAARGHEVDVYAASDSQLQNATLKSFGLGSIYAQYAEKLNNDPAYYTRLMVEYELYMASAIIEASGQYDIIHAHDPARLMYFSSFAQCPLVYTYHGSEPITDHQEPIQQARLKRFHASSLFVAISDYQRSELQPSFQVVDRIYHGIDLQQVPFQPIGSDEILFVGRLGTQKQPDLAIRVAQEVKKRIRLIGELSRSVSNAAYVKQLEILLKDSMVEYVGVLSQSEVYTAYQARLLIHPVKFEEGFGMVLIEAMATGTPVVAYARGAIPEVIEDGVTGFIVNPSLEGRRGNWIVQATGKAGLCEAVERIYALSNDAYKAMRQACRKRVEDYFSASRMLDDYERLFVKLVA
ncbi:glycosyltransferase [Candidatus Berkelbacteria bacterium]|nr:glycosyltransferase [Candidatus Berkelbacteria bacterium]